MVQIDLYAEGVFVSEGTNTTCVLPLWADGNPQVMLDSYCVKLDLLGTRLHTVDCSSKNPLICEKSLNSGINLVDTTRPIYMLFISVYLFLSMRACVCDSHHSM